MSKIKYKKGDIVFVNLGKPKTKEIFGHEQGLSRPCVVIKSLHSSGLLIILPLTSKKPKKIAYYHVELVEGETGLTMNSYVLCHQIRTVSTERVIRKLGTLSSRKVFQIQTVLIDFIQS